MTKRRIPGSTLSVDVEKARAWKKRSAGNLKRGKGLEKVGAGAKRRAKAGEVYGPHWRYVMTLPCLLEKNEKHRCWGPMAGHHVKTVGSGGKDKANVVPLCKRHHRQIHALGPVRFNDRHGLDVYVIARELDEAA